MVATFKNYLDRHKKDVLFGFILAFAALAVFDVLVFNFDTKQYEENIIRHKKQDVDIILNQLEKYYRDAETNADFFANEIKLNLIEFYGENRLDVLKQDLYDLKTRKVKTIDAMMVIANTIRGKTLNGVPQNAKDNNDLIVFLADLIIGDLSDNCATDAAIRSLKEEAFGVPNGDGNHQFNSLLAMDAMEKITRGGVRRTFWHYLPKDGIYKESVLAYKEADFDKLKKDFLEYDGDLEFLSKFEFLAISRINNDGKDLFGNDVKGANGSRLENLQLHVVQGFNLKEQIENDTNFSLLLSKRAFELDSLKKDKEYNAFKFNLNLLFLSVILTFLCGLVLRKLSKDECWGVTNEKNISFI